MLEINNKNLEFIKQIAVKAGLLVIEIYNSSSYDVTIKNDQSPLTTADKLSHEYIIKKLKAKFPSIPVISEEGTDIDYDIRKNFEEYWLIDPLDGTKEFINRNGEFTINIALIIDRKPQLGIIYAPVLNELYWGIIGQGAFFEIPGEEQIFKLPIQNFPEKITAVASRSHSSEDEKNYLQKLGIEEIISRGSSLKFCQVAKGLAHYYVRFGPTMEWDTGAGQAIAEASGATMKQLNGNSFLYNKDNLLNPGFIVSAKEI